MTEQIDALMALQMALARLGYYTGAIDGLFGPRTDTALKAMAAERGAIRKLDLPRFRSGLLRAILAIKETGYGSDTQRRVQAGCGSHRS